MARERAQPLWMCCCVVCLSVCWRRVRVENFTVCSLIDGTARVFGVERAVGTLRFSFACESDVCGARLSNESPLSRQDLVTLCRSVTPLPSVKHQTYIVRVTAPFPATQRRERG